MKNVKRMLSLLFTAALLCTLLTTAVLADVTPAVWLNITEGDGKVTAQIVTNAVVTDGQIKLTYDSSALTYGELTANGDCVAQHAVNPNEPGTVDVAWVCGTYTLDGTSQILMEVTLIGTDASSLTISGTVYAADGSKIILTAGENNVPSGGESNTPGKDPGNSETGDDTPLVPIIIVMAVCLAGIIVLAVIFMRKGRRQ